MIDRLIAFLTRHLDPFLGTVVVVLLSIGLVVLFSASGESFGRLGNQLANILVALCVMWVAANVAPQHLLRLAVPVYVVGLGLLICVALFGEVSNGARRWLHVGVTRIQPSEVMKIGVPLMLAWYFDRYEAILKFKD
ncbi:MAG: FtsW/RodA/SpoVE family cell cycle protein, partial [Betaproteobacteria bacterium]